jgi:prepilin-type processing-associated H-X9-DG protein
VLGSNFNYGDYANATPAFLNGGDGFWGANGLFSLDMWKRPLTLVGVKDGTSSTFLVGEDIFTPEYTNGDQPGNGFAWAHAVESTASCAMPPNNVNRINGVPIDLNSMDHGNWGSYHGFKSQHPGGVQFAYADGSVRYVANTIPLGTYRALASFAGREIITDAP